MIATRNDVAYITGFYSIVTVFVHQLVSLFDMALVVLG